MLKHLVFYDGQCGLCDRAVQFVLNQDIHKLFVFAPLQGQTANEVIKYLPTELKTLDSLVLIENYREPTQHVYVLSKGALRICWLLGNKWTLFGLLSFFPPFCFNWAYHLVAKNRHRLFKNDSCILQTPENRDRFLP